MKQSTLGSCIRTLRMQKNLTQLQLAELLGVTDKAVSKWERDLSYPDIALFPKIADILGTTVDGLLRECKETCQPSKLLQAFEIEKNRIANRVRILAGYCWNWPKAHRSDTEYHDITNSDFGISWNLDNGELFATGKNSVNEAGCIHTTQGLEFDYVGVIIGDDLRYQDGHVVTDFTKRASTDQSIKGLKKLSQEDPEEAKKRADEIIKNTYRTLMTRGMKGCIVYCTDHEMAEYMRRRLAAYSEGFSKTREKKS